MRFLLFFFLTLLTTRAISQEADSITMWKVNTLIANLKAKGVSKIAYKKDYCVGYYPMTKINIKTGEVISFPCSYYFTLHLFWQQGNKGFVKQFDACGESASIKVDPKKVFEIPDSF